MLRKPHPIELTDDERATLTKISSNRFENIIARKKAEVLLLVDVRKGEPELTLKEIAKRLDVSSSTVKRTRYSYTKSGSIDFLFPKKIASKVKLEAKSENVTLKNKRKYSEPEPNLPECKTSDRAKYRVVLTSEDREQLEAILKKGKHSLRKISRIKILLNSDQGPLGPDVKDEEVAKIADVSVRTVKRVRKLFVGSENVQAVLNFNHKNAGRKRKLDGRGEAHLVTLVCSAPPEGRSCWTLRLLADRLVEMELVDSISHVAIGDTLKKTNLSLGRNENG